jgi:hypothetical protein
VDSCVNYNFEIPAIEDITLQGNTNWCLATCMNIVHQDILVKSKAALLRDPFDNAMVIPDFVKLAFVFSPVQYGSVFPMDSVLTF